MTDGKDTAPSEANLNPEDQAKLDELLAKQAESVPDAPGTTPEKAADPEVTQPTPAPKCDPELGAPLDIGKKRTASEDDPTHKHAHLKMTDKEKKALGGGLHPGQPTRGPDAKDWKPPKNEGSVRGLSAEEVKKQGGGLEVGKPTVAGPALDAWNKAHPEEK